MATGQDFLARLLQQATSAESTRVRVRAANIESLRDNGLPLEERLESFKYTPLARFVVDDLLEERFSPPTITVANAAPPPEITVEHSIDPLPADHHPLARINGSLLAGVVYVDVAPNTHLDYPIEIDYRQAGPCTRVCVRAGDASRCEIVERHVAAGVANRVTRVDIGSGATVAHRRIELHAAAHSQWALLAVDVGAASHYELDHYMAAAAPRRSEVVIDLTGCGASCELTGAVIGNEKQIGDLQVQVNHRATDTRSRQLVHAIAAGQSVLTFNGRIEIDARGDGSDATLTSRNLLLAPTARVNAKPELEIHTRNVACSHGATVGQLDPQQLFYLRSRGIDDLTARRLLTRAFLLRAITPRAQALGFEAELIAHLAP